MANRSLLYGCMRGQSVGEQGGGVATRLREGQSCSNGPHCSEIKHFRALPFPDCGARARHSPARRNSGCMRYGTVASNLNSSQTTRICGWVYSRHLRKLAHQTILHHDLLTLLWGFSARPHPPGQNREVPFSYATTRTPRMVPRTKNSCHLICVDDNT